MELTQDEALKKGFEAQHAGQIQEAKKFYRLVLNAQPNHPEANYNMGVLAVDVIKIQEALVYFKIALEANPNIGQYWLSYIDALIKLGNLKDAKTVFDQAKDKGAKGEAFDLLEQKIAQQEISAITATKTAGPYSSQPNVLNTIKLDKALRLAVRKSKDGELAEAKNIYQNILQKFPKNKPALIGLQTLVGGLTVIRQDPPSNQLQPILNLYTQGKLQQALTGSSQMLKKFPSSVVLYNIAGASNVGLMQFDAAIENFKQVLKINPNDAEAHNNIGNILAGKGDLKAAIGSYKQALEIKPDYAEVYNNMGVTLKDKGEPDSAIYSYKKALKIKPDYMEAYYNMAIALNDKGDLEAALESYNQALKINPHDAEVLNNMGNTLKNKGDSVAAIGRFEQALKINPGNAEAYNNIGNALSDMGDLEAAINSYKQAVKIKPDFADAYYNMGVALKNKGALVASIKSFETALKIKPDNQAARAKKLNQQAHTCDWAALDQDRNLIAKLGTSTESVSPLELLSLEDAPERHRVRSEIFTEKLSGHKATLPLVGRPSKRPQRLRVGYFSADFHEHPVAYLMAKVLETHDRLNFEVFGFSIGPAKNDDMRQRLSKAFDVFIDVYDMSNKEVALLVRQYKIDIAIDLTGYTKNSRPGIFAHRAAPVQINYLGYPVTMGADFMDYIIADPVLIPSGYEHYYTEYIMRLPGSFMPTDNSRLMSTRPMTRSEMGLPKTGFVFCCFNNNYKISPCEFDIWMRALVKVEGSVLWLSMSNIWSEDNLRMQAEARGVNPSRLVFAARVPMDEHLARQKLADLFLDTFNYNAHTTASEALWAGLPIVTKIGRGFAARVAASLLTAVGLSELITKSEQEYESLIIDLANDAEHLEQIQQTLMDNRLTKPLFDSVLYTKHLENGYQQAYQRYFNGQPPDDIFVHESS